MIVHQTLHGYADGHRLLASSTPLSTDDQHLIALLSDISGHGAGVSFDDYLTGYPVRAELYALARTWRATEVSRPGSVWTHSLLIEAADLGDVRDVQPLLGLFRRPEVTDWLPYSTPLDLPTENVDNDRPRPLGVSPAVAAQVVAHLYDPASPRAVRIVTGDRPRWEPLVLACWLQQWPTLRPAFTFCTLALGHVALGGVPFALQLVPREASVVSSADATVVTVDAEAPPVATPDTAWLRVTLHDLTAGSGDGSLREFLWRFGDDLLGGRAAFPRLADVYAHLRSVPAVLADRRADAGLSREGVQWATRLVSLVADRFRTPAEARGLKMALFGGPTAPERRPAGFSESEAILALAITKGHTAFDASALDLRERAVRLLETNAASAGRVIQAALEVGLNPIGESALGVLLSGAGGPILATAVTRNLRLAVSPGLWATAPETRHAIWQAVRRVEVVDDATRARIVHVMLDAGCDELANDVVEHFETTAARAVLTWLADPHATDRQLGESWARALALQPAVLLQSVIAEALPVGSLDVLADALDPGDERVEQVASDTWMKVAARAAAVVPEPVDFRALLLAIALDRKGPEAASIAVLTFQPVYDAAKDQQLSAGAWAKLQTRVPRIFRQWDHCERLRRGVAVRFARGDWPMTYLPQVVKGEITLDLLLRHCLETQAGRKFVDQVVRGAPRPLRWGDHQRVVVDRIADKLKTRVAR